jgi:hypothetical protein
LSLYFGKKSSAEKRIAFIPIKIKTIRGKAPPYSSKILLPETTYKKAAIKTPKIIYPEGLLYFEFEINIKYNHKNTLAATNTKKSEMSPKLKIFRLSSTVNELWVIG